MGIDIHAFNFIRYASTRNPLGNTLTIGRQSLSLNRAVLASALTTHENVGGYCEPILFALGATAVESIDFSDYENPTYVRDLGQPFELGKAFNTIVDAGSLEHIFDVANAFRNLISLCEVNGQIIHLLPVNNLSGHGFYQFSSDLLYTIYSSENGFADTVCYYASSINQETWYQAPPRHRVREPKSSPWSP